ncbi:probable tRNA N6-adenosine threonylcarbamoyltransferase, mitochondrial isoform X1 [Cynara cardunculus var. scolymus]|uniref:probable tRNA N6-adenosine threonylcarbamoyltransferase, mitochondrial isoform X1 n=1 Tax=Cynara cardunculus var. scolymus TaxID=59895 RepID=UPI000D627FD6|nr:probable tRNA N6-adenosine threonylcarbamoyltransferase, mitochondrial isoform X1 [Cynara cardunculus var. scolymus]
MASLAPTLSCTISRLNLLAELSHNHHRTIRFFRTLSSKSRPQKSFYPRRSFKSSFSSANFESTSSICSKALGSNPVFNDNLVVLGIETSCDDTAAAVVRSNGEILSQVVSSQADLLARYGGVAPKMAEEAHSQVIDQVVQDALDNANLTEADLSAVAVTIGPGLSLCLRVGVQKARKIAASYQLPIVGVHHMEAHALIARLCERDLQFPFMALLISGGHNLLVLAHDLGHYLQLGTTIDDAIGEAYDKTAKWLGLDLRRSGGAAIEELARRGDAESINLSVPMKQHKDCNFSYAGLKTQVRLAIESKNIDAGIPFSSASIEEQGLRADIAASFQRVAVLHLEERCERAIQWALEIEPSIKHLVVSGGVASNQYVRARLHEVVAKNSLQLVCPPPSLCTDNGVMIAWTGIENFRLGRFDPPPPAIEPEDCQVDLRPRWPLGEEYGRGRSVARSMRTARIHPSLTSLTQASRH